MGDFCIFGQKWVINITKLSMQNRIFLSFRPPRPKMALLRGRNGIERVMGWLHLWFHFHIRGKSGPQMKLFIRDLDFPDLVISWCRHKVYENMDLESQDPRFNAHLGLDQNLIWTKKLKCCHPIMFVVWARFPHMKMRYLLRRAIPKPPYQ